MGNGNEGEGGVALSETGSRKNRQTERHQLKSKLSEETFLVASPVRFRARSAFQQSLPQ